MMRFPNLTRLCLAAAVATTLALATVAGVSAHARYDHSTPSPGQVLSTPPTRVDIYTVQDMVKQAGVNEIDVTNEAGQRVDRGDTTVDDNNRRHFYVDLQPNLPPGRYVVSFKNKSDEDGEEDHGQFAFYIGQQPTPEQKAADAQLKLTSQEENSSSGSSNNGTKVLIGIIVTLVLAFAIPVIAVAADRGMRPQSHSHS